MSNNTNWTIKGGTIYDGSGAAPVTGDVQIADGVIAAVGGDAAASQGEVFDASGLIVTPGIVDLHVHVYDGMNIHSIPPAEAGLKTGVTAMLDMGSAGVANYGTFHKYVMPAAPESIYALLNISLFGVQGHPEYPPYIGDLRDPIHFDVPSAVKCIKAHPDRIVGVKVRLTASLAGDDAENKERAALKAAIEVRDQTGLPLYVHHVMSSIPVADLLAQLQAGDVLTHFYHGLGDGGFTGPDGAPSEALIDARARGIKMDVGHGSGAFSFAVAEPAIQKHNYLPDAISSDIHIFNLKEPVIDMPTTMTKFLHMGMPLEQVVHFSTQEPANIMGLGEEFGLLAPGRRADVTVFKLVEGQQSLSDSLGNERVASQRLVPVCVFKDGQRYECHVDYA